jgi:murein DD-endopeptidase MepM/ murein hydrolase activator NlpD
MISKAVAPLPSLQDPSELSRLDQHSKEAAEKFEAFLYTFMAKNLRGSTPDGMFSSGPMSTFAELFDEEIGKRVGESHGLGLADQLERSLAGMAPRQAPGPSSLLDDHRHPDLGVDGVLTSHFGPRNDPINGKAAFHKGIDIGAPTGTAIHAVRAGRVIFAGPHGGHGNLVEIDHGNGVITRYAHCSQIGVVEGQVVGENDVVGLVGNTGHSTGPHLHFEVHVDGRAVDPLAYFDSPVAR